MQKDIYFFPSSLKNIEELTWLNEADTDCVWIYPENPQQKEAAEDMLIQKLILNPRVLNSDLKNIAILQYTGRERFHFLKKNTSFRKFALFGVEPKQMGIHLSLPKYQLVRFMGYEFLLLDKPELLKNLPKEKKILLAQVLREFTNK